MANDTAWIVIAQAETGEGEAGHVEAAPGAGETHAETLGEEFKSGDCHAGSYETSVVLAADPDAVRAAWRELPPVAIGLLEKMKNGAGNFIEAGARDAYCGAPARASREEGEKTIAALARVIVESVREAWPDLFERAERR